MKSSGSVSLIGLGSSTIGADSGGKLLSKLVVEPATRPPAAKADIFAAVSTLCLVLWVALMILLKSASLLLKATFKKFDFKSCSLSINLFSLLLVKNISPTAAVLRPTKEPAAVPNPHLARYPAPALAPTTNPPPAAPTAA